MSSSNRKGKSVELELVDAFVGFMPAYLKWMKACLPADNLSHPRLRLLHSLHSQGPQIMSDLSKELESTPRNVTTLVDALEREGLVSRRRHPSDRRAIIIELTPGGVERSAKAYEDYTNAVARIFSELPEPDKRKLLSLVMTLRSNLDNKSREGGRKSHGSSNDTLTKNGIL